jgi:hypothetical protein
MLSVVAPQMNTRIDPPELQTVWGLQSAGARSSQRSSVKATAEAKTEAKKSEKLKK